MKYNAEFTGNIIRLEREKRGWTQKKLGDKIGVVPKQISKYEKGDPLPPVNTLFKLCELFDCELGYLLGEANYSDGTRLQTGISEQLGLTVESVNAIKKVTGSNRNALSFGCESERYIRVINKFLSSSHFPTLMEAVGILDAQLDEYDQVYSSLKEKYGDELFDKACEMYYGSTDYEHDSNTNISPDLCAAIRDLSHAEDKCYSKSYAVKVARYELNESFEGLIEDIYPRK